MSKGFRRTLIAGIASIFLLFILKGSLYRTFVVYEYDDFLAVKDSPFKNSSYENKLKEIGESMKGADIQKISDAGLEFTSEHLSFNLNSIYNYVPDELLDRSEANCVGYASLCAAAISRIAYYAGMENLEIKHVRGVQKLLGFHWQSQPWVPSWMKDHDYVLVKDIESNKNLKLDPSLYDYFGISEV